MTLKAETLSNAVLQQESSWVTKRSWKKEAFVSSLGVLALYLYVLLDFLVSFHPNRHKCQVLVICMSTSRVCWSRMLVVYAGCVKRDDNLA